MLLFQLEKFEEEIETLKSAEKGDKPPETLQESFDAITRQGEYTDVDHTDWWYWGPGLRKRRKMIKQFEKLFLQRIERIEREYYIRNGNTDKLSFYIKNMKDRVSLARKHERTQSRENIIELSAHRVGEDIDHIKGELEELYDEYIIDPGA